MTTIEYVTAEERLAAELDEHLGRYVAVRNHRIVASASSLPELLEEIAGRPIDRLFKVPTESGAAFF